MIDEKALRVAAMAIDLDLLQQENGDSATLPDPWQPATPYIDQGEVNFIQVARACVQAYIGALDGWVLVRGERVRGATIAEWREKLSPNLRRTGDCVLAWVNEGDLANLEVAAMLSARPPIADVKE